MNFTQDQETKVYSEICGFVPTPTCPSAICESESGSISVAEALSSDMPLLGGIYQYLLVSLSQPSLFALSSLLPCPGGILVGLTHTSLIYAAPAM